LLEFLDASDLYAATELEMVIEEPSPHQTR
jgi:hypothetical protein